MKRNALATFQPELDMLQSYIEELSSLGSSISEVNQHLQQQTSVETKYPLPDCPKCDGKNAQASKFSSANKGFQKARRSASTMSFAQHELGDAVSQSVSAGGRGNLADAQKSFPIGSNVLIDNREYGGVKAVVMGHETNMFGAPLVVVSYDGGKSDIVFYPSELRLLD